MRHAKKVFPTLISFTSPVVFAVAVLTASGLKPDVLADPAQGEMDLASSALAVSPGPKFTCSDKDVCFYNHVVRNDAGQAKVVSYSFRYRAPQPGSPTVVIIPGGPGDISSDQDINKVNGIPADYGVILTDARFTGLNHRADASFFRREMSSELVADDIINALAVTKTKNPLIYGVSYGTVPATILAAKLAKSPDYKPRAVILDGTVSHGELRDSYYGPFAKEWGAVKKAAAPEALSAFRVLAKQMIDAKALSAEDLGKVISVCLSVRHDDKGANLLADLIALAQSSLAGARAFLLDLQKQIKAADKPADGLFEGYVACRELIPDMNVANKVSYNPLTGDLTFPAQTDCNRFPGPLRPLYDSRKWQIESPTIYLQGEHDPNTPLDSALSHLTSQKLADKRLVIVPDGGHAVIDKELAACSPRFWRALATNPSTATNALDSCTRRRSASELAPADGPEPTVIQSDAADSGASDGVLTLDR